MEVTDEMLAALGLDQEVDSLPVSRPNAHPTSQPTRKATLNYGKFPWKDWMDGKYHRVQPAKYEVTLAALQQRLHNKARMVEMFVVTTKQENGELGFKFFKTRAERDDFVDAVYNDEYDDGYPSDLPKDE